MKPHRPPLELKAERVQGRMLAFGKSCLTKVSDTWEWIKAVMRDLKSVFTRGDRDPS